MCNHYNIYTQYRYSREIRAAASEAASNLEDGSRVAAARGSGRGRGLEAVLRLGRVVVVHLHAREEEPIDDDGPPAHEENEKDETDDPHSDEWLLHAHPVEGGDLLEEVQLDHPRRQVDYRFAEAFSVRDELEEEVLVEPYVEGDHSRHQSNNAPHDEKADRRQNLAPETGPSGGGHVRGSHEAQESPVELDVDRCHDAERDARQDSVRVDDDGVEEARHAGDERHHHEDCGHPQVDVDARRTKAPDAGVEAGERDETIEELTHETASLQPLPAATISTGTGLHSFSIQQ